MRLLGQGEENESTQSDAAPSVTTLSDLPLGIPGVGFILMDTGLSPLASNPEAVQILTYPTKAATSLRLDRLLTEKIRTSLVKRQPSFSPLTIEFKSGKRQYLCRVFLLNSHTSSSSKPTLALVLERSLSGSLALSRISEQFHLTLRQSQAVELLLYGLTNKQIASRMAVSTPTVKFLFRLVMLKMGVTRRTAIISRIVAGRTG
jgi:DNA-binding CsgD family transcriptional regulator